MRITVAYNLRSEASEEEAELLYQEDVDRITEAFRSLRHKVTPIEVSGRPDDVVERLLDSSPDLIFNIAEGRIGSSREAFYPALYEQMGVPFTGGDASLLHLNLDKTLAKTVVSARGIRVPKGTLITREHRAIPKDLEYPLFIKPNAEGSSKGITQDSVVETPKQAEAQIESMLKKYPAGLVVEEFIAGRELSVPFLEAYPGRILPVVEHTFDLERTGGKYNIYDYDMKQGGKSSAGVGVECPAKLTADEMHGIEQMVNGLLSFMHCPDFGRIDVRLREDGRAYFIEMNPLPSLHPNGSLITASRALGMEFKDVLRLIIRSAAKRYRIPLRRPRKPEEEEKTRPTLRELGISVGRYSAGVHNAITDVKGVKVGHVSRVEDDVELPGGGGKTAVRTGVTAIVPAPHDVFQNRLVAGGFVLNGAGEMAGLSQMIEWGLLETPILLTNSLSVGRVLTGAANHVLSRNPGMGTDHDVILPVVGEADDAFLNDTRVGVNTAQHAVEAIQAAKSGAVPQGSIGAGTGMISFDFAGGIGTSSRTLSTQLGGHTIGVLVLSNLGRMVNLTIDGAVVGRDLESTFAQDGRRRKSYGSVITVIATDAPMLSGQLNRLAVRAALGLGRVGSHAATSSGEIILAFSTANTIPREQAPPGKFMNLRYVGDTVLNLLYEAVIEATEEAVLNAMFCSTGMSGREGRFAPPIPQEDVLRRLGRDVDARNP